MTTPTLLMVIAGNVSASLRVTSNLSDGTNSSITCVVTDFGMMFCTSNHGYCNYGYYVQMQAYTQYKHSDSKHQMATIQE